MYRSIIVVTLLTLSLSGCVAGTVQPEQTMQPAPKRPDVAPVASYDIQVTLDPKPKP
jgi:PBP1b-binding outer membrane lipoprotein LpoB